MRPVAVLLGALRYEFWMQVRRRSVWFVLAFFTALLVPLWYLFESCDLHGCYQHQGDRGPVAWSPASPSTAVLQWAQFVAILIPVGIGLVLADRLARDRQQRVDEVLDTCPASLGARLFGKYLGCTLATLVPVALLYGAIIAYTFTQDPRTTLLPLAIAAFAAIIVPAALFVAGFSIAVPALLKVPVYQFLFIVYWFGANLMSPKIGLPSLTGTWLNATGPWAQVGIFHFPWVFLTLHATPAQGYASIVLLVSLGALAICGAWGYLHWRQATR